MNNLVQLYTYTLFMSLANRMRKRPKLRLVGKKVPTVDLLITACNESMDLLLDTIITACYIDYPINRFRVIVCDDGRDENLKEAVNNLAKDHPNLHYHARVKGKVHHYKAGNLQAAIEFVATLPDGPGEMVATLDADMIPQRHILRSMLPHILKDEKMGLVASPQVRIGKALDEV
jgi:cellulose synthase/poly-beta-1,6-N-acetylglucosamine synthase-like glycosyltransferase